jgi:hypothetical protein
VEEGRPGRGAVDKALIACAVEVVHYEEPLPRSSVLWKEGEQNVVEKVRAGRCRVTVISDAGAGNLVPGEHRAEIAGDDRRQRLLQHDGEAGL